MSERRFQRWFIAWIEGVWYGGVRAPWLLPLAGLFRLLLAVRSTAYRIGVLRSWRAQARIIVIGNITVGGTGKTPLTIWLARELASLGLRVGVVSRGYGGAARGPMLVSGDSDAALVGDEALLLQLHAGCEVAIGADRAAAVRLLQERGARVILADDGLQHLRLARDCEVCVVDGERGFGNRRLLPAGPLREPADRIRRVNAVVVNGRAHADVPAATLMQLQGTMLHAVGRVAAPLSLSLLRGQPVHAVAAIGNPQRFFATLRNAGFDVHEHAFPDHHAYHASELDFGDKLPVVMTEKDAVKCRGFRLDNHWYLPVAAHFAERAGHDLLGRVLMDARLLDIMVCPVCKGPLQHVRDQDLLVCRADRLAYPIREGVPVMLEEAARALPADDPLLQQR